MLATLHSANVRNLALAKFLSDAGVPMMAGTDGGGLAVPGMTMQQEFDELARAGISPLKVLQMTTTNPAIFLGRTKSMGLVADGYEADLVLLDANPLESVANLHGIAGAVRAPHPMADIWPISTTSPSSSAIGLSAGLPRPKSAPRR
jgi:imidazolonepropionase-like amidohydrolase